MGFLLRTLQDNHGIHMLSKMIAVFRLVVQTIAVHDGIQQTQDYSHCLYESPEEFGNLYLIHQN